ncbi:MAG: beta-ketoacyl-[acyl-carrier-protein] synthase family protein [Caldilineaceae bacterium]|nr:beta-ketoacyl-[acyl-carrier-protein] synthase family protein [Caldilineaceae bacterium]MBP8122344.1 beta-ketoacyl-[acyl-carrier-protein] synthase family protein [Caldilineaceae bacterium]MBP9071106.1 beta-ketoacyl-[acyl-carrier-protein] synthase family protein [Caldilineaceae bacterium]
MTHSSKHRVVITGCGVASPLSSDWAGYCRALHAGRYAATPLPEGAASSRTKLGARLDPIPQPQSLTPLQLKMSSNLTRLSLFCAEQAWAQAGLPHDAEFGERAGVMVGSGFLNLADLDPVYAQFYDQGVPPPPTTIPLHMGNAPASRIAMTFGLHGMVMSVTSACSSGSSALLQSVRLIQEGRQDLMVAGGSELLICRSLVLAWERLRVLSQEQTDPSLACRPFDRERTGILLGEGAALFVLEERDHALARGAHILAEIAGGHQNSDSLDLVKPDGASEARCMVAALADAGIGPEEIQMVHAHANGTRLNDETEAGAMTQVFQSHLPGISVCAIKAMIGHTMGASGPMAVAAGLGSLAEGWVYPVPNLGELDQGMDLQIARTGEIRPDLEHIMVNTFAFGGINVSLVFSRSQDERTPKP